jgi:hypothetical protein
MKTDFSQSTMINVSRLINFTDHGASVLEIGVNGVTAIRIKPPASERNCLQYEFDYISKFNQVHVTRQGAHCGLYEFVVEKEEIA